MASRAQGLATSAGLAAAGVSREAIRGRVAAGTLLRLHRGVYRVPSAGRLGDAGSKPGWKPVPDRMREWSAVLACGKHGFLTGASAGWVWGFVPEEDRPRLPDVALTRGNCRRAGVRVRRVQGVSPDEVTRVDGFRIATPERALLDLAGSGFPRLLERALAEALDRGLARRARLSKLLARHPRARGIASVRALLASGRLLMTRSQAEEYFWRLIVEAKLHHPEANVRVEGYEVDFFWRLERVIVEVDGRAFHDGPGNAFEADRLRDAELAARGFVVIRVTWRQMTDEPLAVIRRLTEVLARRAPAQSAHREPVTRPRT